VDDVTPLATPKSSEGRHAWKSPTSGGDKSPSPSPSPRMAAMKKPVKKVLSAVTFFPASLRGNNSPKNSDDYDDEDGESRNDDVHHHLLRSMYDKDFMGDRHFHGFGTVVSGSQDPSKQLIKETIELPTKQQHVQGGSVGSVGSSMKSFKQLHEDESSGCLQAVDFGGFDSSGNVVLGDSSSSEEEAGSSASDKENSDLGKKMATKDDAERVSEDTPKRMSSVSLDGLKISLGSEQDLDSGGGEPGSVLPQISNGTTGVDHPPLDHPQPSLRMNTSESLVVLKISPGSDSSNAVSDKARSIHSKAFVNSTHASSVLGYSTASESIHRGEQQRGSKSSAMSGLQAKSDADHSIDAISAEHRDDFSQASSRSSSIIDLDSHLMHEEQLNGIYCPENESWSVEGTAAEYVETPVESSVAASEGQQSYVTYASYARQSPYPVTVTPTEHGDVILLAPLDDVMDVGPQPQASPTSNASESKEKPATLSAQEVPSLLLTPLDDAVDIGPQPKALQASQTVGRQQKLAQALGSQPVPARVTPPKPALLIPTLGGETNLQDHKVHLEPALKNNDSNQQEHERRVDASKIESIYRRKKVVFRENNVRDSTEGSPTGVDELIVSEDEFTEVDYIITEEQDMVRAGDEFLSKPPLPPKREDAEFIASEGWDSEEDCSVGDPSQPFGSFEIHEDALREILMNKDKPDPRVIELRGSLESDCEQSSSIVSGSAVSGSVVSGSGVKASEFDDADVDKPRQEQIVPCLKEEISPSLLDAAVDEESRESKETQIFNRKSLPENEESESDLGSDAPGGYFDYSHDVESGVKTEFKNQEEDFLMKIAATISTATTESVTSNTSGSSAPDLTCDLVQNTILLRNSSNEHWAKTESDSELDCHESDLFSAPSESLSASSSQGDIVLLAPHILARDAQAQSDKSAPGMQDFDNLNSCWLNQWTDMAVVADGSNAEKRVTVEASVDSKDFRDPVVDQSSFLLKEDVGDAMAEDIDTAEKSKKAPNDDNICSDVDGNQYLKIYDLDSGNDTYEVIHQSYELETVDECRSEEDEENMQEETEPRENGLEENELGKYVPGENELEGKDEDTRLKDFELKDNRGEKNVLEDNESGEENTDQARTGKETFRVVKKPETMPHPEQQQSIPSLKALHSLFDAYHVTPKHGPDCQASDGLENVELTKLPPQLLCGLKFPSAKSSKKREKRTVRIKKRAIVKSKLEIIKYDLAYLERGSHHDKFSHYRLLSKETDEQSPVRFHESLPSLSDSREDTLPNALTVLAMREDNVKSVTHASSEDCEGYFSSHVLSLAETEIDAPETENIMKEEGNDICSSYDKECSVEHVAHKGHKDLVFPKNARCASTKADDASFAATTKNEDILISAQEYTTSVKKEVYFFPSSTSMAVDERPNKATTENDVPDHGKTEYSRKDHTEDETQQHEIKCRVSFMLTKLYKDNIKLSKHLAATQSKLEKITRKLEIMTQEEMGMIATNMSEI